jgi:potassium-dependent mechanosensitive channel
MNSSRMNRPHPKFRYILQLSICIFLIGLVPHSARGQVKTLKDALTAEKADKAAGPEKPEDTRKRLEQWLQEARDTLARLDNPGSATSIPLGITPAEMDERRRELEQIILTIIRSIKNINAVPDARKALENSRTNDATWTGFTETPPYSILMIDELLNERDAINVNLTSSKSSLANYERLISSLINETKTAEESVNQKIVAMQEADDATRDAAKWRLEAARAKSRLLAARAELIQNGSDSLKDRISAGASDLALIERKIKTAKASARFDNEDLAKIEKISNERKKNAQKELEALPKRLKAALATRTQAQAALDALVAGAPQGIQPDGLDLAKFRVEVADNRVETVQSNTEELESLIQLENIGFKAYQDRKSFLDAASMEQKAKALESLELLLARLAAWKNVADNEISSSNAELSKLEARASSITSEDPRFSLLNEQRAIQSEKLAMAQRLSQAVISQYRLVNRWVADFTPKPGEEEFAYRLSKLGTKSLDTAKKIWGYEVTSYENSVEVDGKKLTGKVPITLGMFVRALLFFFIGYWITSRIANRVQTSLVTRGHIGETNARTLRNWLMIVISIFLALGTLSFLKIPLTVFAFFGGALAIGIGFGMQTLIKNFISGIIVLAERKIRVGDILDLNGVVGTVVEINTRSSIIRSGDNIETLVPNSVFLENRVTNWTLSNSKIRRSLRVIAPYGSSPQKVMEILTDAAKRHGLILKDPAPYAVFEDFGDTFLVFNLYFWINLGSGTSATIVASDLRLMIEKHLTQIKLGTLQAASDEEAVSTGDPLNEPHDSEPTT